MVRFSNLGITGSSKLGAARLSRSMKWHKSLEGVELGLGEGEAWKTWRQVLVEEL
jgi:hypothetical protein